MKKKFSFLTKTVLISADIINNYEKTVGVPVTSEALRDIAQLVYNKDVKDIAESRTTEEISSSLEKYMKSETEAYSIKR